MSRFTTWEKPEFDEKGMTKWNWMCQYPENLTLEPNTDVGAFTYINAKFGVKICENVEIGSHCSIYSWSTIDNKKGPITIKKGAKIGSHSIVMPGITIGKDSIIGAFSFVNKNIPPNSLAYGIPVKIVKSNI
jgi:acetyltransferase-like isoleucine patch superfamily enzyme